MIHDILHQLNLAASFVGGAPFVLPLSVLFTVVLWRREASLAARWLAVFSVCVATVVTLKIVGRTCGLSVFDDRLISPSGHVALSAVVYGSIGLVLARQFDDWRRRALELAVLGLVLTVAYSRVRLHAHSVAEVVVGFTLGGLAVAAFAWSVAQFDLRRLRVSPVAVAGVAAVSLIAALLLGVPYTEMLIARIAQRLQEQALLCTPPDALGTTQVGALYIR